MLSRFLISRHKPFLKAGAGIFAGLPPVFPATSPSDKRRKNPSTWFSLCQQMDFKKALQRKMPRSNIISLLAIIKQNSYKIVNYPL